MGPLWQWKKVVFVEIFQRYVTRKPTDALLACIRVEPPLLITLTGVYGIMNRVRSEQFSQAEL